MKPKDSEKFSVIMFGLSEEYGGNISEHSMDLKFEALKNYSIDQIAKAGTWIMLNREKTFPAVPTVQEFVAAIKLQTPQLSADSIANIQADLVIQYSNQGKENVTFNDPITQKIMTTRWQYGSWMRDVKTKDLTWFKKEFIEAYKSYSEGVEISGHEFLEAPEKLQQLANSSLKEIGE